MAIVYLHVCERVNGYCLCPCVCERVNGYCLCPCVRERVNGYCLCPCVPESVIWVLCACPPNRERCRSLRRIMACF